MRLGKEAFVPVGYSFWDTGFFAVHSPYLYPLYIGLRRYLWRSLQKGSARSRRAYEEGRLCTTVSLKKLRRYTRYNLKTLCKHLHKLRDLGWIKIDDREKGSTLLIELGHFINGEEYYYIDGDLLACQQALNERMQKEGYRYLYDMPDDLYHECAHNWFEPGPQRTEVIKRIHNGVYAYPEDTPENMEDAHLNTCEGVPFLGGTPLPRNGGTPLPRNGGGTYVKRDKAMEGDKAVEKGKETLRVSESLRSARSTAPLRCAESSNGSKRSFEPKATQTQGAFEGSKDERESSAQCGKGVPVNTMSEGKNEKSSAIDNALDNEPESREGDTRFESANALIGKARARADRQQKKNTQRSEQRARNRILQQREEKTQGIKKKDQKKKNLKGGTNITYQQRKDAREIWDIYVELLREYHNGVKIPVPNFDAKGNGKLRGQIYNVIDMYGVDVTKQALEYMMRYWDKLHQRFFGRGAMPNISMLFGMHGTLVPESALLAGYQAVIDEVEQLYAKNPRTRLGAELKARYTDARKAKQALGLE